MRKVEAIILFVALAVVGSGLATVSAQAGVTFYTDEAAWEAAAGATEDLPTDAFHVGLASEVAGAPAQNQRLGRVLTWAPSATGLSRTFRLRADIPADDIIFSDHEGTPGDTGPVWVDALSIGDINNWEDDDAIFLFPGSDSDLSGSPVTAFAFRVVDNSPAAGETITVSLVDGGVFTTAAPEGDGQQLFFGLVSDDGTAVASVRWDEDAGGDDTAVAALRFNYAPHVEEPPHASQSSVDALAVTVDGIESKLDSDLDVPVSTRASQAGQDALSARVDVPVSTRASQVSIDQLALDVDGIDAQLDADLDLPISTRASQVSVDALTADVSVMDSKLDSGLDLAVSTRASQLSVDELSADLSEIDAKLDADLDVPVSTRASQSGLDELTGDVSVVDAKLNAGLDAAVSTRSSQLSVDAIADHLLAMEDLLLSLPVERVWRATIERELSGESRGAGGGRAPLAMLFLPESYGGHLEEVGAIAVDTLLAAGAAGCDTHRAASHLADAEEARAAGEWLHAWDGYVRAYRDASGGPCN